MNELIKISIGEQGSSVVSARELYEFLGFDASQWARWAKKNIINNAWAKEGEDWQGFDMMSRGNQTTDFALSLDFAKRLSMLARTEKGEEIRKYFIEKESQLRQLATAPSTEQVLIQVLSQQTQLLSQLRADVDSIIQTGHKLPPKGNVSRRSSLPGKQLGLPGMPPSGRSGSLRQLIHTRILDYCSFQQATTQEVYTYLYRRLFDVYGINTHRLTKGPGESLLDALERYGHLDRLYSLIMAELSYNEE